MYLIVASIHTNQLHPINRRAVHMFDFDYNILNNSLAKTVQAIQDGKKEIFEIGENVRSECSRIESELATLRTSILEVIEEEERLTKYDKASRQRLYVVSKNFNEFTEEDIKETYEKASQIQSELLLVRQNERELLKQRRDLEMQLIRAKDIVGRSDILISKVSIALSYLTGDLQGITNQISDIKNIQMMGLKIIKAQEEERQRISKEIHDGPAQSLANIVLKAEYCNKLIDSDHEKAKVELTVLKDTVRDSLGEIRRIIYDLIPMSLNDLGLIPALQRLIREFKEQTGLEVDFLVDENSIVKDSTLQLTVYRITQELLNNIRKHARANKVIVILSVGSEKIATKVVDDGVGFDPNTIKHQANVTGGLGLYCLKERIELLGGKLMLTSRVGMGTIASITIPLSQGDD